MDPSVPMFPLFDRFRPLPARFRLASTLGASLAAGLSLIGLFRAFGAEPAVAPRGEPIKPLNSPAAIRGEPIKPLAAPAPAASNASNSATSAAATAAPILAGTPASAAAEQVGEYTRLGFDKLSTFKYEVPDDTQTDPAVQAKADDQIPVTVKDFNGKRIALKGFMLPLKVEGGLVTELLIMRDQSMCCYGAVPKINEWVSVKMTGKGVKPVMDQAVTLYGRLKVGGIRENGYLVGIYAMDGEKMDGPGI